VAASGQARAAVLRQFRAFARNHGWVICALPIAKPSRGLYEKAGLKTLRIGSGAVVPVLQFQQETARDKWWRWQRNRAVRSGWNYEVLPPPHSAGTLAQLRAVSDAWLTREGRSEQGFALGYFDTSYLQQCTLHLLRAEGGSVVAFANELPRFAEVNQVTVDLIRFLPDSQGAMPALLLQLIEGLDAAVTPTFDLGFVPLARIEGELARLARFVGGNRFSVAGLERFKSKFRPDWQPTYVAYDGDIVDLARIAANLEKLFAVE